MTGRDVARVINTGRIALGAALMLAPRLAARGWIGQDADAPGVTALARGLGVREAVLGAMGLHTMDNPQVGPRWQRTLALCDGVDLAATLAVRRSLPRAGVALIVVLAGSATGGQLWAAGRLAKIDPEPDSVFPPKRPSHRN
ncbi:MAG TPA: hypothetical protein VF526_06005 [Solirubrobacteraceae bacterium]|jgi:hypothetical protein